MRKLLIVDGSNLLFQMFYGMPARILNKDGKPIHGTVGFVGALLKIIRMVRPTHAVVLFDGEHENERVEIDAEYKGNRTDYSMLPEEETPFSQLPDIYASLAHLRIPFTETTDCETDDLIAAYCKGYEGKLQIVISSFDSDFFQLITDMVSVLRYRGDKTQICDREYVLGKFGVEAKQYADFKSLTGDKADNIKGAPKIGAKTAAALINQFGSLKGVLENTAHIARSCIRESIETNKERLEKNRRLICLGGCAKLPFALDELAFSDSGETTTEILIKLGIK